VDNRAATVGGLWSGPIGQRFDPPPPARKRPRFLVPAGVKCAIRNVVVDKWRPFTTTRPSGFERFARYERTAEGGFYEFRLGQWILLASRRFVVHREDLVAAGGG
jgi:hypothetical protein